MQEAERLFDEAVSIAERTLLPDDPSLQHYREGLAACRKAIRKKY